MTNKIIYLDDFRKRVVAKQELIDLKRKVEKERLEEIRHLEEAKKKEYEDIEYLSWLSNRLDYALLEKLPFYEVEILVDIAKSEGRFR